MLEKYKEIETLTFNSRYNYVFELYGKRNKILIEYSTPLDTRLLFAINRTDENIIPPSRIKAKGCPRLYPLKTLNIKKYSLEKKKNLYTKLKEELEDQLFVDEENKILKGKEGYVLYFIKDDIVTQIKNKPDAVLKYHWGTGAISYESIYTTVVNAFENWDNPTIRDVETLLEEEFSIENIEKSRHRIEKILSKVFEEKKLKLEVIEEYKKLGIDIKKDKGEVMRRMAKIYPKELSSKIYNFLANEFG